MLQNSQREVPAQGTSPEGARDEQEAAARVRQMFSSIAPRYDFLNHLLSLSFDRLWRRRAARRFQHILVRPQARVLDLCCGTGDLTFALAGVGKAEVFGGDFAHPMLVLAGEKNRGRNSRVRFFAGDALALPFQEETFDLITAAFGFRNLVNYEGGLREILRLLKPGGEVGVLDFSEPRGALFGAVYRFYFRQILPRVGGVISGSSASYAYLPASVAKFPPPEELRSQMQNVGFVQARFEIWTGGIVALHVAQKPF